MRGRVLFLSPLSDSLSFPLWRGRGRRKRRKLTKLPFSGKPMHVSAAFRGEREKEGRRINFNPFITQVVVEMEKSNRKKPPFFFFFSFHWFFCGRWKSSFIEFISLCFFTWEKAPTEIITGQKCLPELRKKRGTQKKDLWEKLVLCLYFFESSKSCEIS